MNTYKELHQAEESINTALEKANNASFHKISLNQKEYNYLTDNSQNISSQKIITHTKLETWENVLYTLDYPMPLSTKNRMYLSRALHYLAEKIVEILEIGWTESKLYSHETSANTKTKKFKPDATCTEKIYIDDGRLITVEVKLSILAASQALYKYLPLYQNPEEAQKVLSNQFTFYNDWFPKNIVANEHPVVEPKAGEQHIFFPERSQNNILYICYLDGHQKNTLSPGDKIAQLDTIYKKDHSNAQKKLPENMEVRFTHFSDLPELYAKISGVDVPQEQIEYIIQSSKIIENILYSCPDNADQICKEIFQIVKSEKDINLSKMFQKIKEASHKK